MVLPSLIYGMIELSSEGLFLEFVCLLFYPLVLRTLPLYFLTETLLSLPTFSNLYIKLTPPSLRATSPIFLRSKNTEEEGESNPLFIAEKCAYIALRQLVRLRDTAGGLKVAFQF